jgi:GT2 family glycosyltransferase
MSAKVFDFSVVVPACARPAQLAECLARLAPGAQTCFADNYDVIVTDDSPDEAVRDLVKEKFPWVQWTEGPRRGPAANRNHGAKQARREWIAFTDDDCLPEPGWLAALAEGRREHPSARVLEGRTYADRPRRSVLETSPINDHGGNLWSCNFAIENALFRELGGFDERYVWATMEDADLAERLRERKVEFPFLPKAAVCHPWRPSDPRRASARHVPSLLLFLQLHPQRIPEQMPRAQARNIAKAIFPEFISPLFTGRWRELVPFWYGTRAALGLMWTVPRLSHRPAPAGPGPQPWPPIG